jgi:hypothetical protein
MTVTVMNDHGHDHGHDHGDGQLKRSGAFWNEVKQLVTGRSRLPLKTKDSL